MEMPLSLQTLPAEALDILRYYGRTEAESAHADDITEGTGLTDRGFGKGIRRLVTRNYLSMAGEQVYRLTDQGRRAVTALEDYDLAAPDVEDAPEPRYVRRRLVIAAPVRLLVGQPTRITVGVDDAQGEDIIGDTVNLLLRVSVINGDPEMGSETLLVLTNRYASQIFEITPGVFTKLRVRVELFQEQPDEQFAPIGGLYVDVPITADPESADPRLKGYGTDFYIREYAS
jgi:hypothetical protein